MIKPRLIAFYLPQFHPIPENDEWWGPGYTEWRSVTQARPLFRGHYQPHEPADLGYYDLRLPEIREQQAKMARDAGIEGFMYWHYWMGNGRVLLDRPFKEVLESGKPDFPFCLGWANHNWTNKNWVKHSAYTKERNLIEVLYTKEDYVAHFKYILPALKDSRYITVDGKPVFYIFAPDSIPDTEDFIRIWQDLAKQNGLKGIHFIANTQNMNVHFKDENGNYMIPSTNETGLIYRKYLDMGYDAIASRGDFRAEFLIKGRTQRVIDKILRKFFRIDRIKRYTYNDIIKELFVKEDRWDNVYPCVIPNWDRSPRAGKEAVIYDGSTPALFGESLREAISLAKDKSEGHNIIFVKSWNEWGEGNHLEPDLKFGHGYLNVMKEVLESIKKTNS